MGRQGFPFDGGCRNVDRPEINKNSTHETATRRTVCVSCASLDLWEPWVGNRPGRPGSIPREIGEIGGEGTFSDDGRAADNSALGAELSALAQVISIMSFLAPTFDDQRQATCPRCTL